MEVPEMMQAELMKSGVPESAITLLPSEEEAIERGLSEAEAGDLLVVFADELARSWKQIIYFKKAEREAKVAVTERIIRPAVGFEELLAGSEALIRDERGVRLARGGEISD
jgi:cyanophycin synthetase